jgi:hypothetical protein
MGRLKFNLADVIELAAGVVAVLIAGPSLIYELNRIPHSLVLPDQSTGAVVPIHNGDVVHFITMTDWRIFWIGWLGIGLSIAAVVCTRLWNWAQTVK